MDFIPYGRQSIDEEDLAAVTRALRSDFLTTGPEVEAFEREFAAFLGAKHVIAVCNATAALHLAMRVAGIGPGHRVLTSPNTFLSSANAAAFVGATPDFADIDPATYTLSPQALAEAWTEDTKAVVAVAHGGQAADMPAIAERARARGALVIEDACHGTGGGFQHQGTDYKLGAHPYADLTTFSFHPVKSMTTGEGGVLVTDRDDLAAQARLLRNHGVTRDQEAFLGLAPQGPLAQTGPWSYEMHDLGYNYRLTDLQAALGRSQLAKLPGFMVRRREIVAAYNEAFADLPFLTTPALRQEADRGLISWHLYTPLFDFEALGQSRARVMARLREQGIGTQVLYIPVHLQPWYRKTYGYGPGKCPRAEAYYRQALSLPLHPSMGEAEVARVISAVRGLAH